MARAFRQQGLLVARFQAALLTNAAWNDAIALLKSWLSFVCSESVAVRLGGLEARCTRAPERPAGELAGDRVGTSPPPAAASAALLAHPPTAADAHPNQPPSPHPPTHTPHLLRPGQVSS